MLLSANWVVAGLMVAPMLPRVLDAYGHAPLAVGKPLLSTELLLGLGPLLQRGASPVHRRPAPPPRRAADAPRRRRGVADVRRGALPARRVPRPVGAAPRPQRAPLPLAPAPARGGGAGAGGARRADAGAGPPDGVHHARRGVALRPPVRTVERRSTSASLRWHWRCGGSRSTSAGCCCSATTCGPAEGRRGAPCGSCSGRRWPSRSTRCSAGSPRWPCSSPRGDGQCSPRGTPGSRCSRSSSGQGVVWFRLAFQVAGSRFAAVLVERASPMAVEPLPPQGRQADARPEPRPVRFFRRPA